MATHPNSLSICHPLLPPPPPPGSEMIPNQHRNTNFGITWSFYFCQLRIHVCIRLKRSTKQSSFTHVIWSCTHITFWQFSIKNDLLPFLSNSCRIEYGISFYLSLMAPLVVMLICNAIIFSLVVRQLSQRTIATTNKSHAKARNRRLKASISLATILGLNWGVGLLLLENTNTALQWIFTLLVSTQGFTIFVAQVLTHRLVKSFATSTLSSKTNSTNVQHRQSSLVNSQALWDFLLRFRRSSSIESSPYVGKSNSRYSFDSHASLSKTSVGFWASGDAMLPAPDLKALKNRDANTLTTNTNAQSSAHHHLTSASSVESDASDSFCDSQGNGKLSRQRESVNELSVPPRFACTGRGRVSRAKSLSEESRRPALTGSSNSVVRRTSLQPHDLVNVPPKLSFGARARLVREKTEVSNTHHGSLPLTTNLKLNTPPHGHENGKAREAQPSTRPKVHKQAAVDLGGGREKSSAGSCSSESNWLGWWKKKHSSSGESETSIFVTNSGVVPNITITTEEDESITNKLEKRKDEQQNALVTRFLAGSSISEDDVFESDAENPTNTSAL